MPQCAIAGCNNTHRRTKGQGSSVRYHRFPGDARTRALWTRACGRLVQNCNTARICSRHFSEWCYERDIQHELLGLPVRSRLRKGALPDRCIPGRKDPPPRKTVKPKEDEVDGFVYDSAIAVLLAVGLVPASQKKRRVDGGLPQDNKMHVMEEVNEASEAQPSSPGHAEQRPEAPASDEDVIPIKTSDVETKIKVEDEETKIKVEDEETEIDALPTTIKNLKSESPSPKRRSSETPEQPPTKKIRTDYLKKELYLRNAMLTEITDSMDMTNYDQIQSQTEQISNEIQTLNELAKEKEREWNNIVHVKKLKEELLLRIQRQKQVFLLSNGLEISESDPLDERQKGLKKRPELNRQKVRTLHGTIEINGHDPKAMMALNKQRPVRDVQSIIADYRQRHPETVPRRGRRIRTPTNGQSADNSPSSQVLQNLTAAGIDNSNDLGIILNALENSNQNLGSPLSGESHDTSSFKEILVQFAKLSQGDRQELIQSAGKPPPPPYPEVTVHPVTSTVSVPPGNSLLHGILTKNQPKSGESKSNFSPTLARLLTAPERSVASQQNVGQNNKTATNVSISDILSHNKARNEITITPVGNDFDVHPKRRNVANEDEEAEDSIDRLVIDESGDVVDSKCDNNSEGGDDVPQCQGCNQKSAQFVCAGCGNQWYCSRECQVTAWDEHSEVCSG